MDANFEQALGWSGAAFHTSIIAIKSDGLNKQYIGGGIDTLENYTDIAFFRFASLILEQTLSLPGQARPARAGRPYGGGKLFRTLAVCM
jgi:hypothetical protein